MKDLVTYCPDTSALLAWVEKNCPHLADLSVRENPRLLIDKTPTHRNGEETLAVVRCRDEAEEVLMAQADAAGVLSVLGEFAEMKADDSEAWAIYTRVRPLTPVTYTDSKGVKSTVTPAEEMGRFAE